MEGEFALDSGDVQKRAQWNFPSALFIIAKKAFFDEFDVDFL